MVDASQNYYDAAKLIQEKLVVNSLKNILRQLRLSSTGRKAYLQSRLLDYLSAGIRRDDTARVDEVYHMVMAELNPTSNSRPSTTPAAPVTSATPQQAPARQAKGAPPYYYFAAPDEGAPKVNFQESPFYQLIRVLGSPITIPITLRDMPRKLSIRFSLPDDDLDAIRKSSYSILLLSTNITELSQFQYSMLQYPQQLEIRVNHNHVPVNVRGLKNKPGTARAPDLTQTISMLSRFTNVIDITVQDVTQQFAMYLYLVKLIPMDSLVDAIQSRGHITKESTIQKIINENNDDDVQAISTVLSLKCPLSYCRITVPVRSMYCDHIECFDASSFLLLQQQATTWTCPICNKALQYSALAVDDYLLEILRKTAAYDIDEIEIAEDGEWKMPKDAKLMSNNDSDYDSDEPAKTEKSTRGAFKPDDAEVIALSDSDNEDDIQVTPAPNLVLPPVIATNSPQVSTDSPIPVAMSPSTLTNPPSMTSMANNFSGRPEGIVINNLSNGTSSNGHASHATEFSSVEDVFDMPLPPSSLLQRSQTHASISNAPTSNERSILPSIQQNLSASRPSNPEDVFSTPFDWEASIFNRPKWDPKTGAPVVPPASNASLDNSTTTASTLQSTMPVSSPATTPHMTPPVTTLDPRQQYPAQFPRAFFTTPSQPRDTQRESRMSTGSGVSTWQLPGFNTLVPGKSTGTSPAITSTSSASNGSYTGPSSTTQSPSMPVVTSGSTVPSAAHPKAENASPTLPEQSEENGLVMTHVQHTNGTKRAASEVIDLTLSDDDDDQPASKR